MSQVQDMVLDGFQPQPRWTAPRVIKRSQGLLTGMLKRDDAQKIIIEPVGKDQVRYDTRHLPGFWRDRVHEVLGNLAQLLGGKFCLQSCTLTIPQ